MDYLAKQVPNRYLFVNQTLVVQSAKIIVRFRYSKCADLRLNDPSGNSYTFFI